MSGPQFYAPTVSDPYLTGPRMDVNSPNFQPGMPSMPQAPQGMPGGMPQVPAAAGGNNKMIFIILGVLLLVAIVIVVVFAMKK